jgi:Spy/CpxP family protein refolding chaperone
MTEQPKLPPRDNPEAAGKGRRRRRFFAGMLAGTVIGGLLATGVSAFSHEGPGWGGRCMGRHAMSPDARRERLEFATDWVLTKANATDQQKQQVKGIVQAALQDLGPIHEQHLQHREAFRAALTQPAVDRATLDQLRQAEMQLAEQASARIVQALADVSEVLTPEQRTQLVKLAEQFRH